MSARPRSRRQLLLLVIDIAVPIGLYYVLRGLGMSAYLALLIGAIVPALTTLIGFLARRTVDGLGLSMFALISLSAGVSALTSDPRFLLVRDGWLTGAWGLWFFASLFTRRPVAFAFARVLLEGRRAWDSRTRRWAPPTERSWDQLWDEEPAFRRIWRMSTVMWGAGTVVDAVLRVIMAYTLPVDEVPALGGALWPVTFVVLQVITNIYYHRAGLWRMLIAVPQPAISA
ncbi:MAG TPA: VC0807 family protein [Pseudonocardiaceae bacterium]|nr:VC0807 family protein [Pseudonocardiaceae bacterium]